MIRVIIIIASSILIGFNLNAQEETSKEEELISLGKNYFTKVINAYDDKNYDSALYYLDSALYFIRKTQDWELQVKYMVAESSLYSYKGDYLRFDSIIRITYQLANKKIDKESSAYGSVLTSLGIQYLDIGDYNNAIKNFERTLDIEKKIGDKLTIASLLNNLGDLYFDKGDYDEALNYYQQSKKYRFDEKGNGWRVAKSNIHIGNTYRKKNNKKAALKNYKEAIDILHEVRSNPKMEKSENVFIQLTIANLNQGELALENKEWKEAEAKVEQAEIYSEGINIFDKGRGIDILGEINEQQDNYKKALEHFFKSLELANEEFDVFEKHPIKAEKTLKIASLYTKVGDWKNSLQYYLRALELVTHDFNPFDFEKNPLPENIYSNLIALEALKGKAECFFQFYKKNKNKSDLETAYQTYQASLELIPELRKSFRQEGSKELLSSKVLPLFEEAIKLALILFEETTDTKYLQEAFSYVEGNKAILLLESMNENTAKKQSGIPVELLKKELELNLEISYLGKQKNEEKQKLKPNEIYISELDQRLFELNNENQSLIKSFENDFPKYLELKSKTELATVEQVQKKLPNYSTALIEYFVGNQQVYVFTITKNNFTVDQFEKGKKIEEGIKQLIEIISHPPSNQNENIAFQNFTSNAQYLFQKLIKNSLSENTNSLMIVPDDILGFLPFEILLLEIPADTISNYSQENLSYLLEDFDISYSYSSTLLVNQKKEDKPKNEFGFVGFAPSFQKEVDSPIRNCEGDELINLKNSKKEISQIQAIWGGKIFIDEEANISSFQTHAPKSDIIHLATHACIDQNNHQFNKIFFTDAYLLNHDLYHSLSQSRLAVLSACNTGSGQLIKGEGIMSLSRGFIHAGCPSVVISLWSVNDGSTSHIMENFYKNLDGGKPKDSSLRQAKLDYLNSAKKSFQHPFYWAAFVQIGDTKPLCGNAFFSTKKIILAGVLFFIGLFLFQRIRRKGLRG